MYVQNVVGHGYSWNKCFIVYSTNAEKVGQHVAIQEVKLKILPLQYLLVLQSFYNVTHFPKIQICITQNNTENYQKTITQQSW